MSLTRISLVVGSWIVILAQVMISCSSPTGTEVKVTEWELIWQDEFNGDADKPPNSDNWGYDIGTDWGNQQLEYDTDRIENVALDGNGNLAITAREESYLNRDYTSGRILTRDKFESVYGRYEARIKLPTGAGIWPAFWMLGSNIKTVGWPQCGEIDIMEYRGQAPSTCYGSLHGPGYSGSNAISRQFQLTSDRFDNDFHVFAIEWNTGSISWSVDDSVYHVVHKGDQSGDWVFNRPFFIVLNVAVGGNWIGPPSTYTSFPQTMLVDYVRVYGEKK